MQVKEGMAHLPGGGDTVVTEAALPGRGLPTALRACRPCEFPKRGKLTRNLW